MAHVMTSTEPRPVIENVQLFSTGSSESHDPAVADLLQNAFSTQSGQSNVS
jgi:hypothetical protein